MLSEKERLEREVRELELTIIKTDRYILKLHEAIEHMIGEMATANNRLLEIRDEEQDSPF